jgi:manganese transport system ATP-binding protein
VSAAVSSQNAPAVRATGLVLRHGERVALAAADLALPAGALTVVIGPNGSGKSTLLRTLSGLHAPSGGTVEVLGTSPGQARGRLAHVLQRTDVNNALPITVREVVAMGCYGGAGLLHRGRDTAARVARGMERVAVADLADRHLTELSGGQRQRVLVAQALVQHADLLLLDEPIAGLDVVSNERIDGIIAEEIARGVTIVLTTHDLHTALQADHVVLLAGRVVAEGPPADVLTQENLVEAYGGHLHELPGGGLVLDDPAPH